MLTLNITNTSGVAIAADDGVLPRAFAWMNIAIGANANAVLQISDLDKVEYGWGNFTLGERLQTLKQKGKLTFNVTDAGDNEDTGSVADHCVATQA
jgi:hypothetical protein